MSEAPTSLCAFSAFSLAVLTEHSGRHCHPGLEKRKQRLRQERWLHSQRADLLGPEPPRVAPKLVLYPELPPSKPGFICLLWSEQSAGAGLGRLQLLEPVLRPPGMGPMRQVLPGLVLAPGSVTSPQGQLGQQGLGQCPPELRVGAGPSPPRGWVSGMSDSPTFLLTDQMFHCFL